MKKTYKHPTMKVVAMHQSQMVCSSPVFGINEGPTGDQDVDTNARRSWYEIWSEEYPPSFLPPFLPSFLPPRPNPIFSRQPSIEMSVAAFSLADAGETETNWGNYSNCCFAVWPLVLFNANRT